MRALGDLDERVGESQQLLDAVAPEVVDRQQVLHARLHFDHLAEVDAVVVRRRPTSSRRVGQVLADVVGADRQLAVAAVDHHRELHGPGPAVVGERVERGPDRCGR